MVLLHKFVIVVLLLFIVRVDFVAAQESVTLSISPTLYDMSAEPGQEWRSTLKVVNVNPFDLTVYAEVVNFTPRGEGGDGRFVPVDKASAEGVTLAEWFTISGEPIVIPREQSVEIPFAVRVPEDASPGGHFAAILVGTKPIENADGKARLQTAQMVTSLFFARVAGEVVEAGSIREFTTADWLLGVPEVTFSLRFENKGNVHLQPQGEIKIYNMWGEERGIIPINQYTNFGNVLPESIRKFLFTWKGEWSISDIGRYTAIATLGYGTEEKQFSSSKTFFWVLPLKLIAGIVIGLCIFFALLSWLVRLYVRHMLVLAGIKIEDYESVKQRAVYTTERKRTRATLRAPVQAGILDLTKRMKTSVSFKERLMSLLQFVFTYRLFFLGIVLVVGFIVVVIWYIHSANTEERPYEVVYLQNETSAGSSINSEEILYNQLRNEHGIPPTKDETLQLIAVAVVNRSGESGVGAKTRVLLEDAGYEISQLSADFTEVQVRTVIIAEADKYEQALALSKLLGNAPVSVSEGEEAPIIIYVGSDRITM